MKKILITVLVIILLLLGGSWLLSFPVTIHDASGATTQKYHFLTGLTLDAPETIPEGMTFDGWYYDEQYSTPIKKHDHHFGTVMAYAKYNPITYSITYFDENGSKLSLSPTEYTYGNSETLPELKKKGYEYVGWDSGNGKPILEITETTFGDLNLKPMYKTGKYKIEYELNGGSFADKPITEYTYGEFPETLQKPTRTGYAFKYWTVNGKVFDNVTDPSGDLLLVANWEGIYDSTREGDAGKIQLAGYAALLYKGADQERFNAEGSAITFKVGNKTVITDSYVQGFRVLAERNDDLLWTVNGVTKRYKRVSKYIANNTGTDIVLDDRRSISDLEDSDLCAYVQNVDGTLTVVFFAEAE